MTSLRRMVVTWTATAYGGAEKSTLELCRTIRRRFQIEATAIIWHHGAAFDFDDAQDGDAFVVHCYDADEYRQAVAEALGDDSRSMVIISNHRTYQIDLTFARERGLASAVTFRQTPMVDEALRTLPSPTASELQYMRGGELDWDLLRHAAALVGVSDFGARGIARFAPQHTGITRIYNGLTMPGGVGTVTARPVRRFLIVARLIDWKAVDFGMVAFSKISACYPDARLQIAGDGEEETHLRKLAEQLQIDDRVEFLGFVHDIRKVYLSNDCLLHLSGIESFGRVVIEASLCGLPVVVPQSAGTGELVINEHTGLTFDASDVEDCVRAMDRAYHLSAEDYERLAVAGQQRALTVFNPDRVAEDYVALANSLL